MNEFCGHVSKFRYPSANVITVGIELLPLRDRIEYAEPRLCIAATTRRPLPARVVVGPVAVGQQIEVVLFAATEVDEQVFGEKARGDHARAVVHESGVRQFTCGSIDHGITSSSLDPRAPAIFVTSPRKIAPLGAE